MSCQDCAHPRLNHHAGEGCDVVFCDCRGYRAPSTGSRVYYMPALTGGPVIVDETPGAAARFWEAMAEGVRRHDWRRGESK